MRLSSSGNSGIPPHTPEGEKRCLNSELWHACAGPLISLPAVGSRVVYFPQGHSEQVAASTNKEVDCHIPNYPNLPPQLVCQLHDVTMHADVETDEVYAQMTLQPLSPQEQKESYLPTELGISKQPTNYFCKTLTASDTSTHGGFSVPRRAAEKVFPPLDFTQQPPAQELIARDLHDNEWKFRHIFRGQPKRHLLTTGWSVFVSAKRLVAGDSVLFIWNENNQLFLGIRRSNRPQTVMPSSVLSSDSMHIGLLAAAAHASATNSRFTIFYNPRASPSEFVIPLSKFAKAVYHTRVSVGMRFRMLFETEESSVRRYMGTITGVSDLDHLRWPNSHWRSVKVGWDESTADERQPRVSLWEIEPLTTFPMYPSPFPLRLKRPWPSGLPSLNGREDVMLGLNSSSPLMWPRDCTDWRMQSLNFQGSGVAPPLMLPRLDPSLLGLQPPDMYQAMAAAALQEIRGVDHSKQMLSPSILEFQQAQQNIQGRAVSLLPGQILQQVQSQPLSPQVSFPTISENLGQAQSHSSLHQQQKQFIQQHQAQQQQLYHQQFPPENHHHQQIPKQQQNHELGQHHLSNQQMPHVVVSSLSQLVPSSQPHSTTLSAIPSYIQQPNYPDNTSCHATTSAASASPLHSILSSFSPEEASQLLNIQRSNPSDNNWVPKRIGVDSSSPLSSGVPRVLPQMGSSQTNMSQFSGRECSVEQDVGGNNNVQNNLLFGVNIDSSSLLAQNGIVNLRTDPTTMPFSAVDLLSDPQHDFPLSTTSNCLNDFPLKPPTENTIVDNVNNGTFVKVSKSGSFGRSLDITRFSSYPELRGELGRMFGLEGQLEDPLRSGWQLVFVDRENDILLVGDDPWQEFVNNVWCIKILSPTEVLHMGKQGLDPSSNPNPIRCDGFESSRRDSRNLSTGITSVGSLDY